MTKRTRSLDRGIVGGGERENRGMLRFGLVHQPQIELSTWPMGGLDFAMAQDDGSSVINEELRL